VNWAARAGLGGALSGLLCLLIVSQGPAAHDAAGARLPRVARPQRTQRPATTLAARLDAALAAPWPHLQQPDGRFRNILGGGTRYGEAALGYALLQTGVWERDPTLTRTGLRGIAHALGQLGLRSRQSVFENLATAAAYNLARRSLRGDPAFRRMRLRWRRFLETRRYTRLDSGHSYDNHYLADAVATLELLRSGLRSSNPSTVLGNQAAALAGVEELVNVQVPALAASAGTTVHGERTFVLSDPPDNPLAYQGLSLGLYARAIALLGRRASPLARRTLGEVARASWWLAAPDGDLAWMGRSDEESWALSATAYGAAAAARLPAAGRAHAAGLRALAQRALLRLRGYGVGPRGPYITPAVRLGKASAARRPGQQRRRPLVHRHHADDAQLGAAAARPRPDPRGHRLRPGQRRAAVRRAVPPCGRPARERLVRGQADPDRGAPRRPALRVRAARAEGAPKRALERRRASAAPARRGPLAAAHAVGLDAGWAHGDAAGLGRPGAAATGGLSRLPRRRQRVDRPRRDGGGPGRLARRERRHAAQRRDVPLCAHARRRAAQRRSPAGGSRAVLELPPDRPAAASTARTDRRRCRRGLARPGPGAAAARVRIGGRSDPCPRPRHARARPRAGPRANELRAARSVDLY
jgi:hypothetical protein